MSMQQKPRVAIVGTGGTIASVGRHSLELVEYIDNKTIYSLDELLARFSEVHEVAEVVPVSYSTLPSTAIGPAEWLELNERLHSLAEETPGLNGVVVTHGTASLEETAYFLNLSLKIDIPVVLVGAQRPATGLSTDGALNLVNAVRVAGSTAARGLGVLVLLNDEIQAAREVTKTSTLRLQTFRSPDFGALGHADADAIAVYRKPIRRHAPDTEFDVRGRTELPRVDVLMSYAGSDGAAVGAFIAAGARGIVSAGFAPGLITPAELTALQAAERQGVTIVQSSRVGSGRVGKLKSERTECCVTADNLTSQKARVLLSLALTLTDDPIEIQRIFDEY